MTASTTKDGHLPTKLLIPMDAEVCASWDAAAARCGRSRHDWIVLVLGNVCDLNPAPLITEPKAKPPGGKPVTRINVRATTVQWEQWELHAKRAYLPVASWARLMLSAAANPELSKYMRRRFALTEQCATGRTRP